MYPLNVSLPSPVLGYAVANTDAEHQALSSMGYLPAYTGAVPRETEGDRMEVIRLQLDALGIAYDKRLGAAKLMELLPT